MRKRRTLMKRLLAIVLVVVMVFTSQNLSGIVSAMADESETFVQSEVMTYVSDVELPSNDELFAGYVDKEFLGEVATFGTSARERLADGAQKNMYDVLKENIENVAGGTLESTVFSIDFEATDTIFEYSNTTKADAITAFEADMAKIIDALLVDCPYDLYWFDKTAGFAYSYGTMGSYDDSTTYDTVKVISDIMYMYVAGNYQPDDYDDNNPTVNTALTSATSTAVANAKAIVESYDDLEDYEKLVAYKDKICELVTYDSTAASAGNFSQDNDPWQLIHVFDNDASTNVVCEGYSKAFQYLCDMSEFKYNIYSYIVTGTMTGGTGSGGHMWNIVTMVDNYIYPTNYLVDITNSDAGSIGQDGGLFLAGTAGDIANGYTFTVSDTDIKFTYDSDTTGLWGTEEDSILKLAESDYVYTPSLDQLRISDMHVVVDSEYDSTVVLPDGVAYDHSTRTITLNNANLSLSLNDFDRLIDAIGDYTIVINGDNTITPVSDNASSEEDLVRVIRVDGDLTISGTGSLAIDVSGINVQSEVYGIDVCDNLIINGGNVSVTTGDLSNNGYYNEAIYVEGNLTINAGCINAVAGNAPYSEYGNAYGIMVQKNMTVAEGVVVNATAGDGTDLSCGVCVGKVLTSSGNITASAGKATSWSEGILANILDANGGRIVATAGESNGSYGIEGTDFTIADAYVEAYGDSEDICFYGSLDIDNSVVLSRGQKTVAVYGEAALQCDLETDSDYTFEYVDGATLSLGEYSIILANGGTISDEALAGIEDEVAMVTVADGTNIYYSDIQTALTKAMDSTGSVITLLSDVSDQIIINNGEFTIDLNGYDIVTNIDYDYAVTIFAYAKLTIKDSSEEKSGVISNIGENQDGYGIYVTNATLVLDEVTCKGGISGINIYSDGNVYVRDSVIEGSFLRVYNENGNLYISGSSVVDIDVSLGGTTYISSALTDGAAITFGSKDSTFDVVAKAADGYTITESDLGKIVYDGIDGYVLGINSDGDIQEFGDLATAVLSVNPNSLEYSGTEQSVIESVKFSSSTLIKDTDYTVEGVSGTTVDEYTVTIKGKGNYIGTLTEVFYIDAATLTVGEVLVDTRDYDGTKTATVSSVTFTGLKATDVLTAGTDYTITSSFADSNAGVDKSVTYTITLLDTEVAKNYAFAGGARSYTGTTTGIIEKAVAPALSIEKQEAAYGDKNVTYAIAGLVTGIPVDAGEASYSLGGMVPYGWSITEDGILTISEFTVTAGLTGSVEIVISTANYEDATVTFIVESKASDVSNRADVILSDIEFEYNGLDQTPTIKVVLNGTTLVDGTDYDITYPSDSIVAGDKEVTITFKGNYTGTATATYKIEPKALDIEIVIKDKQYDGKTDAEIESVTLNGVVAGDDVSISYDGVTVSFTDSLVGNDKYVSISGEVTLTGDDAANYSYEQPSIVLGNIVNNYTAVQGVDYTINSSEWINKAFVITAKDGYELSYINKDYGAWAQTIEVDSEGVDSVSFYVRNKATGAISNETTEDYCIDYTRPTGIISITDDMQWDSFGGNIGYRLFFNTSKNVEITGFDTASDIAKIQYYVSEEAILDEAELLLVSWSEYTGYVTLTQNSKQYIYAKITDYAGNYCVINTYGIVVYTDAEAVTTEVDYTKKSDAEVKVTVKLNDNTIQSIYIVNGDTEERIVDGAYVVSGNTITLTNQYLDDFLEEGTYTFRVEYNPFGVNYDDWGHDYSSNVESKKTEFTVNVSKATGVINVTNEAKLSTTYGKTVTDVQYEANHRGTVNIHYKVKGAADSTYTETKPVNVGDYTIRVTLVENLHYEEASCTADFTISKAAAPTVPEQNKSILRTIATTGNTINISALLPADKGETSYVATKNSSLLENVGVNENGILSFDTLISDTEVTETISIEVTMANYKTTTIIVKVAFVDKEVVTITGVQAATGLIYDGTVKQGYTGIPTSKYTGEYVITYAKNGATISNLAEVEPIDAGAYTVTIAVPNDNPYYMGSVTLEFTIGKATPVEDDITITSPLTLTYDGSVKDVVAESANAELGDIAVYYYVDGKWTATGPVNAGAYDVAVDIAESNNYKSASKLVIGELQITQKDIAGAVVTLEESDLVYDGTSQAQKLVSVVLDGVTLSANDYEVTGNTGTNAGDYELTITGKGNFKGSVKASWSIAKKSLSIIADEATKVYGEADPEFTYKVTGLVDGDSIVVALKRAVGENVGEYSITLDSFNGDNYDMTFTAGKFTITAKDITEAVVTLGDELTYNGKEQTQNIVSVEVNGKLLSDSDYQVAGNVGMSVGDYMLTLTGKGNYTGIASVEWKIAKKDIAGAVITLDDEVFTYDEDEHTKNVVSVVVDGVTLDATEYQVTGNVGTNAGGYELSVTIVDSENYTGVAKAEWTIAPMEITDIEVTVDEDETFVYDGTEQTKEVLEVVINGEALDESGYEVIGNVQKDSGEHVIVVSLTGNYSGTVEILWTIKKAASVADVETNELPKALNEVSSDVEKLSDVKLPEGWVWSDEDADITLEPGKEITATAIYVGEDKANYENTTMTVKITRAEKVVDDQPAVDNPYTGDTRNTMLWLYVLVLSGLVAMIIGNKRRSVE